MSAAVFLSIMLSLSLDKARLSSDTPGFVFDEPAIIGKPATPTPVGVYILKRGYSTRLGMRILIMHRGDDGIVAIHPNLKSRERQIKSPSDTDNRISGGCIGVDAELFDRLWAARHEMVIQVH